MDTLLNTPRDLRRLKDNLRSLKLVTDSRASYQTKLNDNDALIDDIQQKKADLIKQKSDRDRRTNRNEKIVKQNQTELKNKQLTLEEIISSSNDKTEELESIRLLNAKDNDSNDEAIKSRIVEIDKIEIDIEQLYAHKKKKNELASKKRIQEGQISAAPQSSGGLLSGYEDTLFGINEDYKLFRFNNPKKEWTQ